MVGPPVNQISLVSSHDNVITWKRFELYWPFQSANNAVLGVFIDFSQTSDASDLRYHGPLILPDTQKSELRMPREYREPFPRYRGLGIPTRITVRDARVVMHAGIAN